MAAKINTKGKSALRALGGSPSGGGAIASKVRSFEPKSLDKSGMLIGFVGGKGERVIDFRGKKASSYRRITVKV
jgi:hypothetical protein